MGMGKTIITVIDCCVLTLFCFVGVGLVGRAPAAAGAAAASFLVFSWPHVIAFEVISCQNLKYVYAYYIGA